MSTKSFQCRWAFLSLSGIAEKFIRDLSLPRSPSNPITHQLVAISTTRSVERAREWLAHQEVVNHQGITIYTSYEEMLKAGDFDVVYISTPHHLHFQQASVALQYSCNILLEKPAVMNQGQLKRLYELAKKHDAVLMEAMWTRYFPLTHYFQQDILPQIFPEITGAGSLFDIGCYPLTWVDLALKSIPSPVPLQVVHAETIEYGTSTEPIDDVTTIILSCPEPPITAIVTLSSSIPGSASLGLDDKLLRKKNAPCIRIQGTRAEVAIPFPPIRPETLTIQHYSPDKLDENGFETEEIVTMPVHGWGLWYQADVIARAVHERQEGADVNGMGQGLVVGSEGSLRVSKWLDEAKRLAGIKFDPDMEKVW